MAVLGPPGGDRLRPLLTPAEAGGEVGEEGRGDDWELLAVNSAQNRRVLRWHRDTGEKCPQSKSTGYKAKQEEETTRLKHSKHERLGVQGAGASCRHTMVKGGRAGLHRYDRYR